MKTRFWHVVLIGSVLTGGVGAGVDLSSPKSAAKSYYAAVNSSDAAAVRECLLASNNDQHKLSSAYVELILAGKKMGEAAKEKFGAAGNKLGAGALSLEDAALIDKAEEKQSGDDTTVNFSGQSLRFHKTDGGWKLVVEPPAGAAATVVDEQVALFSNLASAMNETAGEISSGKFPAVTDAETAIQQRFSEIMAQRYKPATQPTTRPE